MYQCAYILSDTVLYLVPHFVQGSYASSLSIPNPGPFSVMQYNGVTFEVDAIIKHPSGVLVFEASSGDALLVSNSYKQ